ncbi:hypothetical protein NC651_007820 [Populus alba x Populus x berolinensis]|nr:hypothetical protein NC651_007820 [Populus alba x Populus x berolinensis]
MAIIAMKQCTISSTTELSFIFAAVNWDSNVSDMKFGWLDLFASRMSSIIHKVTTSRHIGWCWAHQSLILMTRVEEESYVDMHYLERVKLLLPAGEAADGLAGSKLPHGTALHCHQHATSRSPIIVPLLPQPLLLACRLLDSPPELKIWNWQFKLGKESSYSAKIFGVILCEEEEEEEEATPRIKYSISVLKARVILCFPFVSGGDIGGHSPWNQFIAVDISSPAILESPTSNSSSWKRHAPRTVCSLHLNVSNLEVYLVNEDGTTLSTFMPRSRFCAQKIVSVSNS